MFLPMSLSVGFSMIASFLLAMTLVPVLAVWLLKHLKKIKEEGIEPGGFNKFRRRYGIFINRLSSWYRWISAFYFLIIGAVLAVCIYAVGLEIFPKADAGQAQVRLRLKTGTRIERTEAATLKLLSIAEEMVGKGNLEISSAFIGTQPSSYPVNLIHLWTSGPHEAVIKINLDKEAGFPIEQFKEELRNQSKIRLPDATLSFEPGDLVEQVLNLGSSNPLEIAIVSRNLDLGKEVATRLEKRLKSFDFLRDVQIATPLDNPVLKLSLDRVKSGQLGLTVNEIARSTVAATSSSRFTQPNYWLDNSTGTAYQIQVEYPQYQMNNPEEVEMIPVANTADKKIFLGEVASWSKVAAPGEYDRLNQQRFITVTANIHGQDLGSAVLALDQAIAGLGQLPAGVNILRRGQVELLDQTIDELQLGLLIAVAVIFLMLAANFQSFGAALTTISIIPAVIAGSLWLLLMAGHTLNIQSYMGAIMAVGVAVANAILYMTNAEEHRKAGDNDPHVLAAFNRVRPILMTSFAMIAGMIPLSLGLGEGGDQIAPLGVAVIGGLLFSMLSTLLFLPLIYKWLIGKRTFQSVSLNPDDQESKYFDQN